MYRKLQFFITKKEKDAMEHLATEFKNFFDSCSIGHCDNCPFCDKDSHLCDIHECDKLIRIISYKAQYEEK